MRWREPLLVVILLLAGLGARAFCGSRSYVFAGSDSYGYNKLADQVRTQGRYALDPPPAPLHWARPWGYPLYVMIVKWDARAEMNGGEGWQRIKWANIVIEVFGTGLLLYFAVRRLAGWAPAALALGLLMIMPFNAVVTPAALTETFATFVTTATAVVALYLALDGERRAAWWFALGGALLAWATLTRPDGLILAPAFLPAVLARGSRRTRAIAMAVAIAGFVVVYAPWPIRNQLQLGEPHWMGGRIDRYSQPVEHYQGSWAWLRSYARDWDPMTWVTTCLYDTRCDPRLEDFDKQQAFDSPEERERVRALLAQRKREGHTAALSAAFQQLADERRRAHPLRTELGLPLSRMLWMWVADHSELVPPRHPASRFIPIFKPLSVALLVATLLGLALALRERERAWRLAIATLALAIFGRVAVMGYTFYCMPRYLLEVVPLTYALVALGLSQLRRTKEP